MKYSLTKNILGYPPEIQISKEEFHSLKNAKKSLLSGLSIEEIYDMLLSNYEDFEVENLKLTVNLMIRYDRDYDTIYKVRLALNKMTINLLTTCRLYIDSIPHFIKDIILNDSEINEVNKLFNVEYDSHFEYRFMYNLRNYAQHRWLPIHLIQFSLSSPDTSNNRKIIYTMNMASDKLFFKEDNQFKKEVLKDTPDEIDIKAAMRIFIESLSQIHISIRNIISDKLNNDRNKIESTISRFQNEIDKKAVGLAAVCKDGEGKIIDEIPLLLEWDDIRKKLIKRNRSLTNLINRYVSGEIKKA